MARPATTGPAPSKREALIDAALTLFGCEGYRAVGIDALLQRAGVAKMTLYKHFRSKEDLIATALEQQAAAITTAISARIDAVPPDAPDRPRVCLLAVFAWLEDWLKDPTFHGCLFAKAAGEYPHSGDLPRQAAVAFKASCRTLLERLCTELPCPHPIALAAQLELLIEGAASLAFLRRDPGAGAAARQAAAVLIDAARLGDPG